MAAVLQSWLLSSSASYSPRKCLSVSSAETSILSSSVPPRRTASRGTFDEGLSLTVLYHRALPV